MVITHKTVGWRGGITKIKMVGGGGYNKQKLLEGVFLLRKSKTLVTHINGWRGWYNKCRRKREGCNG